MRRRVSMRPSREPPVIGLCAAVERARWSVWDDEAVLLPRAYVDAVQRAGGLAVLLPPDPVLTIPASDSTCSTG